MVAVLRIAARYGRVRLGMVWHGLAGRGLVRRGKGTSGANGVVKHNRYIVCRLFLHCPKRKADRYAGITQ